MKIEAITRFKHERETYEAGLQYDVPEYLAGYFVFSGFARDLSGVIQTGTPPAGPHVLDIHSGTHPSSATKP